MTVERIQTIRSTASDLESTSLVLITGLDIFFTRAEPSRKFDVLSDDFNFVALIGTLGALSIGAVALSGMAASRRLAALWK